MPTFYFLLSDGIQAEVALEAENAHMAMNDAMNALAHYTFRNFPPPEHVSVTISDAMRNHVATLELSFSMKVARGVVV
jgi:hypothetical protein